MCGKVQESELTDIIHLICISAVWGQHPAILTPGLLRGAAAGSRGLQRLTVDGEHPVSTPGSLRLTIVMRMAWRLQHPLLSNTAGSTLHSQVLLQSSSSPETSLSFPDLTSPLPRHKLNLVWPWPTVFFATLHSNGCIFPFHLNAEFQRIARRDKKAFLSDQCKEIEENNRMEKTCLANPMDGGAW